MQRKLHFAMMTEKLHFAMMPGKLHFAMMPGEIAFCRYRICCSWPTLILYASVTFATVVVLFICLEDFPYNFFGIVGDYMLRRMSRLGMSVTTQGGSGRQYVTGSRRNIFKYRFVLLNVYRFRET